MPHAGTCEGVRNAHTLPLTLPSLLLQIQQDSLGKARYSSSIDCAKQLYREGGIRSVYKGTMATLLRGPYLPVSPSLPSFLPPSPYIAHFFHPCVCDHTTLVFSTFRCSCHWYLLLCLRVSAANFDPKRTEVHMSNCSLVAGPLSNGKLGGVLMMRLSHPSVKRQFDSSMH